MISSTEFVGSSTLSEQQRAMANDIVMDFVSRYRRYDRAIAYSWWRWLLVKLRLAEWLPNGGAYFDWRGKTCPVGALMDPNLRSFILRHHLNTRPFSSIAARWGRKVLREEYHWLAADHQTRSFVNDLRRIHDTTANWNDHGLTLLGRLALYALCEQYGLNTGQLLRQAIHLYDHRRSKERPWQGEAVKYAIIVIIMVASAFIFYHMDK